MNPDPDAELLRLLAADHPVPVLNSTPVWHAAVDIGERESLGRSPLGERWIVPIAGGRFWGAPGFEAFRGQVLAGGADRQLLRADGVKELQAIYEMQTADCAILSVCNAVIVDERTQPQRYAMSRIHVTAPEGPHAWMNRRLFVGTLQRLRPQRSAVLIRGFLMTAEPTLDSQGESSTASTE